MSWKDAPWAVLDTETTGVDPATARIWEIAIVFVGGELDGRTTRTLVNPGVEIPREVVQLCKLTPGDLKAIAAAPSFCAVRDRLPRHMVGRIPVGYNALEYDWPLLEAEYKRSGSLLDDVPLIDPLVLVRHLLPGLRSKRLSDVAQHLGAEVSPDAHRAAADCWMTVGILRALCPRLPDDFNDLMDLQESWRQDQQADRKEFGHWLIRDRISDSQDLILSCGKHCGTPVQEVDPGFLKWALTKDLPPAVAAEFRRVLARFWRT